MSRLKSDVESVMEFCGYGIGELIWVIVMTSATALIMLRIDITLTLLAMCTVPAIGWLALRAGARLRPMFGKIQQETAELNTILQENPTGHRVVRAFAREDEQIEKFDEHNRSLQRVAVRVMRFFANRGPLMSAIAGLGTVAVL